MKCNYCNKEAGFTIRRYRRIKTVIEGLNDIKLETISTLYLCGKHFEKFT